ncbi:MAG: transposase [Verrucomicrobia bacterium]|nr:transposase [Verrucomicrobiota bacterium]
MPQSLAQNLVHLIFSTKNRERWLTATVRPQFHSYLAGILRDMDCPALVINSVFDHVHLLFMLSKNRALADVVMEIKRGSSKWIKTQPGPFGSFHWQNGYGAFSIGQSGVAATREYIEAQEEHHRVKTFQEEFRAFLKRYEVEFDERYVWD